MCNTINLGFDEVGRGALAGPVVVGCVLGNDHSCQNQPCDIIVRDSKKMSRKQREKAFTWITNNFMYSYGLATAEEVDDLGITKAVLLAAQRARNNIESLNTKTIFNVKIVVDGNLKWFEGCEAIVKGDDLIYEISLASIVAKVYRDRLMIDLSITYPQWGFAQHVGYGTRMHREVIRQQGIIAGLHRKSFVRNIRTT